MDMYVNNNCLWLYKLRVLSEVDLVLGTKSYVECEDLQKLEYTEQVSSLL